MPLFVSIRVRGVIKENLRSAIEPIALRGDWENAQDPVLRNFANKFTGYIPCGKPVGPSWWRDQPWPTSYCKETGEWSFECGGIIAGDLITFEDYILPYCFESISHYESCYLDPDRPDKMSDPSFCSLEGGKIKWIGYTDEDGYYYPASISNYPDGKRRTRPEVASNPIPENILKETRPESEPSAEVKAEKLTAAERLAERVAVLADILRMVAIGLICIGFLLPTVCTWLWTFNFGYAYLSFWSIGLIFALGFLYCNNILNEYHKNKSSDEEM